LACHRLVGTKRIASDAHLARLLANVPDSPFWKPRMAAARHSTDTTSDDLRGYLRAEMIGRLPLLPPGRRPPADGRPGVPQAMVPPRCTGLRVVCSATYRHTRTGLNVRSQSAEAAAACGRFTTVALEELRRFPGMREDQGHGDGGAGPAGQDAAR
jgi:hypothetical protein